MVRVGPTYMHFFISRGDGSFHVPVYPFNAGQNYGWKESDWATLSGDITGTCRTTIMRAGVKELHSYHPDGTNKECWHKDGLIPRPCMKRVQFNYPTGWEFKGRWTFNSRSTVVGDFNGDGRVDIAKLGDSQMDFFISRGDGTFWTPVYKYPKAWNYGWNEDTWTTFPAGDFDGDAKADIVRATFTYQHAYFARGNDATCFQRAGYMAEDCFLITTFKYPGGWYFSGPWSWNQQYGPKIGDFNGDGRDDFANLGGGQYNHLFLAL